LELDIRICFGKLRNRATTFMKKSETNGKYKGVKNEFQSHGRTHLTLKFSNFNKTYKVPKIYSKP